MRTTDQAAILEGIMSWILIGIIIIIGLLVLIAVSKSSLRGMDEDATLEARQTSQAELQKMLHPPAKTEEEKEEENRLYQEQ